jgi:hypothetical protein
MNKNRQTHAVTAFGIVAAGLLSLTAALPAAVQADETCVSP